MNKAVLSVLSFAFLIVLTFSCSTFNEKLIVQDSEFSFSYLQNKTILAGTAQIVENTIPNQTQISLWDNSGDSNFANLEAEIQSLLIMRINEETGLLKLKPATSGYLTENNNDVPVIIPMKKVNNIYKPILNQNIEFDEHLSTMVDYLFVTLAVQLESVDNVNEQFKSIDLVEPGIRVSLSYAIVDVFKNKIVVSGVVRGVAEKSRMIDRTLGRNAILLAANNAISELVEAFEK